MGWDIGIQYDLADSIYMDFGTPWSYDFITFRIKPYLSIGINLSSKRSNSKIKIGKHKKIKNPLIIKVISGSHAFLY
ncbi:MAG: hypothetical protein LBF75_10480 [Treponema sp.]|jgi:hypothetical protein|nr:hypothetical protein [Treponema sp.]